MPSAAEPAKPAKTLPPADLANLARAVLDDRLVERHLAVAGDRELSVAAHRQNRRGSNLHASVDYPDRREEGFSRERFDRRERALGHQPAPLALTASRIAVEACRERRPT